MTEMKRYMTDRSKYERPAMRVVELQHRTMLLQASANLNVTYTEEDWDNE